MPKHDFSGLLVHYPEIITGMHDIFTSHTFIQSLAQQHQRLYIEALHAYRDDPAPFQIVHGILAKRLHEFPHLVQLVRDDAPSTDIFGRSNECAEWRKVQ